MTEGPGWPVFLRVVSEMYQRALYKSGTDETMEIGRISLLRGEARAWERVVASLNALVEAKIAIMEE